MSGGRSFTLIESATVADPPVFVAVIVYEVAAEIADGVPEITPVEVLNARPAGNAGVMP